MGVLDNIPRVHMVADTNSVPQPLLCYSRALISNVLASFGDVETCHKLGITILNLITITYQQSCMSDAQLENEPGLKDKHAIRNWSASKIFLDHQLL